MIRSMTAFAPCERAATGGTLGCELRAVNHRFHELSVRAPEELRAIEPALRERVVVAGQFMLDSEANLRAGLERLGESQP